MNIYSQTFVWVCCMQSLGRESRRVRVCLPMAEEAAPTSPAAGQPGPGPLLPSHPTLLPGAEFLQAGPAAPIPPHTFTQVQHFQLWGQCMGPHPAHGHCGASSATSSRDSFNYTSGQFVSMSAHVQRWECWGEHCG